jgi:drug/metabolite transporter (DMT)-like permease
LASAIIHLGYSLCLQRGYQVADLSVVYPIARGTGPLFSSIGAFILLQEPPTWLGVLGLAAVVAGIGCISTQGDLAAFRRPKGQEGVRWGLGTGSLIAAYTVVDGYGVKVLGIHPVLLDWFSNFLRLFFLGPLVLKNPAQMMERMKGYWWLAVGVGLFSPLSYILVLSAVDMGAPLSLVAPAREMSMMIGAIFGMLILREPVNIWRVAGCATIIAGVVLLGAA